VSASGGFVFGREPQNEDELYLLVKAMWGVTIPRHKVCPEHVAPFTAFADAYFGRNSLNPESKVDSIALWHGSRGLSGKSYMLSILGLTKAFLRGSDVNLLGGSFAQSANIHEHMRAAMEYKNAPTYMIADDGAQKIKLSNRARIRPLTASQRTVRGPHPPFLLLDEIDEMELAILDAALGQPMPQKNYLGDLIDPYTVMCSTWQNPEGTFTAIKRRAEENDYPVYTWCYKDTANPIDGWLSEKSIEEKKASIPKEMWRVEYELGEPSIGNRAFDSEAVEATFCLPFEPITQKVQKDFEEYVFEQPQNDKHATYVIGADWAKEQDYTVIAVLRTDEPGPLRLVYYVRVNRRPYPVMVGMFNEAMNAYQAQGEYDRTGLGNVITDYIDTRAHGFYMVGEKRASMLSEYVNAVEKPGTIAIPKIPTAYLAHKYAQVGDLYSSAMAFHLPDEVCAIALAYYRYRRQAPPANPLVISKSGEPNRYEKHFEHPNKPNDSPRRAGDVTTVESETTSGFSLLV
jgi:hypothetical protein